ncbi:unnamed protein product [Litomosoides sigmodontis]|uniref:ABC transmembrane type-1 domain-containing protein n=1 Tax=Litomosoides sigmodontis TaxID=42156 RepID=A0A3P6TS83_LITSI|nr:unnamed protein product [Litomosoides sigmodontis]
MKMAENAQRNGNLSDVVRQVIAKSAVGMNDVDKQRVPPVADANSTNAHRFPMDIRRNANLIEKGSEAIGMQCRNAAIIISSLIICFYHETHLSLVVMSVIPLVILLNILSQKLSKKSDVILTGKFSQTIQMEKDLLLEKNSNDKIANDDYGGYLLDVNGTIRKGDVFIIVLSMALIVDSISTATTYHYLIKKGVSAALYIWNLQQFDYQSMLAACGNRRCSINEITVTLITVPELKKSAISPSANPIIRFVSGTRNVLRNYHNHKLFLLVSFILAVIHGFEQAAYNLVIGQIFIAMLGDTPNVHVLTVCAMQLSAIGFAVFISRTVSTLLAAVASEHMAVSFRVILSRQLLKMADKEPFSKSKINMLVDENISLTSEAKSLYHPHLSELMTRITSLITNIAIGFIYSWEIALLGLLLIVLCLAVQIEMEFEALTYCYKCANSQCSQKKKKPLISWKYFALRAVNFSLVETFGFALKAICYTLTAFICYHKYKHQAQAFMSVVTLFTASQEVLQLPNLIKKLRRSWYAVDRIFAYMHDKSSRNSAPPIPRSIRLPGTENDLLYDS